jgi:hypothetical protein
LWPLFVLIILGIVIFLASSNARATASAP